MTVRTTRTAMSEPSASSSHEGGKRTPFPALPPGHLLYTGWARLLSFILAVVLSVLILVWPHAVAVSLTEIRHGLLSLLMWGMAAGFVHGVGYVPVHRIWRVLLGPMLGWPIMIGGIVWVVLKG